MIIFTLIGALSVLVVVTLIGAIVPGKRPGRPS
jgi:hypothetical protein